MTEATRCPFLDRSKGHGLLRPVAVLLSDMESDARESIASKCLYMLCRSRSCNTRYTSIALLFTPVHQHSWLLVKGWTCFIY